MKPLLTIVASIAFGLIAGSLHAQSIGPATLNAAGGSTIIGTNEFDWSIGEMTMVSTFTGTNIIVTQGMLQPAASTGESVHSLQLSQLKVFPNPASTIVNLQYTSSTDGTLTYKLMDMSGQVVASRIMSVAQNAISEQINVSALACATYMLEVTLNSGDAAQESTSFKIEKIQ